MKKLFTLTIFCVCCYPTFSQIGFSTPLYTGKDAKLIDINWGAEIQLFIPLSFPIKIKDSIKTFVLFQPAIKWDWYNFDKNLIIDRQNGFTSFIEDTDVNHTYKNKFLKTSSMMQSSSFCMPVNLLLRTKKLKHFLFAPGFYVEYLIGGKFKRRYNDGSQQFIINKFKDDKDFYGFQRFQYGLCGHITYKFITVYGIYSLTSLFKPTEGIDARKYTVGIWFNFFWKKHGLKPY